MTTTTQKLQKSQHLGHIAIVLTKKHPFPIFLALPSWNHCFTAHKGFFYPKNKNTTINNELQYKTNLCPNNKVYNFY